VGFYHFGNGNRGGALTMLERGLKRLARYPDRYCRVELSGLRREVADWRARIEAGEAFRPTWPDCPSIGSWPTKASRGG